VEIVKGMQIQMQDFIQSLNSSLQDSIRTLHDKIKKSSMQNQKSQENHQDAVHMTTRIESSSHSILFYSLLKNFKLEIPKFQGGDPIQWIYKIEKFFNFHQVPVDQCLTIASFALEDEALEWMHWLELNNLLTTWPKFLKDLKL